MKKFLALLIFAGSLGIAHAQQADCTIVNDIFSQEDLVAAAARLNLSPEKACFLATEGVIVNDFTGRVLDDYTDISTLLPAVDGVPVLNAQNFDESTFNVLNYNIDLQESKQVQFRIGYTGKVISIYSLQRLNKSFAESLN